jgi:hypothetical protein
MTNFMVADSDFWQQIHDARPNAGGVYKLHCLGKDGYLGIDRLGGTDQHGILYIGAAAVLSYRLASLRKAVCAAFKVHGYSDPTTHPAGVHFHRYPFLREKLHLDKLCVTLEPVHKTPDDPDAHFKAENNALMAYCVQFGEAPPFNLKLGGTNVL